MPEKDIPFVSHVDNPPNVPQARPIETLWTVLERKIYENNCEAKNIDHLVKRIKRKSKELDQEMLQGMHDRGCSGKAPSYVARWTIFSSLNMVFCSICHALSNKQRIQLFIF